MTPEIPAGESLTVEFKSDRDKLPDRELAEAVVCLANADGGEIWLGVENDGTPTGLDPGHRQLDGLGGLIASRTSPAVSVTVEKVRVATVDVARISVPKGRGLVATSGGVYLRRSLRSDGTPECRPIPPHALQSRLSYLGADDPTRRIVDGATLDDLDPAERARLRQFVERFRGDRSLLDLSDEELDGVVGARRDGKPTLLGLLLFGKQHVIEREVPSHEVAFQVLDTGERVRMNEWRRAPLLQIFDWLETTFAPLNPEDEIQVGLFRVPVPLVEPRAYREAVANALTHRDYGRLGAVHVRLEPDALIVSNPGGFVEGVTTDNILTTDPRPRNPALADAFKRAGLVERTGRGVDLIFRGLLRYGRPRPDYSGSTAEGVKLRIPVVDADLHFLEVILGEEERRGGPLPLDSLLALSAIREHRRLDTAGVAEVIQKDTSAARRTLEALVETGLLQAHGKTRGRSYTLAPALYAQLGDSAGYTRQAGFDRLQQEQLVLGHVRAHGEIRRADVVELCRLTTDQASRLLRRMADGRMLVAHGERRWRYYTIGPRAKSR